MLLFLDKDYLVEAVQQKRSFLSRCLLTIPRYSELYPHKGNLQSHDSKYRLPWEKIKADTGCLQKEALKVRVSTEVLTAEKLDVFYPEPFESIKSLNDSLTECINFDLDSDVIPSSNPESPDVFPKDDSVSEGSNLLHETFRKGDLPVLPSNNENLKLETFLSTKDEEKLGNQVPEISKLISKLKPVVVSDPLKDENGQAFCEDKIFRSQAWVKFDGKQPSVEPTNLDIIKDIYEKQQLVDISKQTLDLEDVVTESFELTKKEEVYHALNTALNTELNLLLPTDIDADVKIIAEVNKKIIKNTKDVSLDIVPYSVYSSDDEQVTFLDINEPDFTDVDDICEEAFLDTPLPSSPTLHHDLSYPECSSIDLNLSEPVLLGKKEKEHIKRVCFSSELYCGEIFAYRLSVPYSFDIEAEPTLEVKHIQQVSELCKLEQLSTAPTDLQLGWDIAKISDIGKDPTHIFDKLKIDTCGKPVCGLIETFDRALPEEFNELPENLDNEECELESLDFQPEDGYLSPINTDQINGVEINIQSKINEENSAKCANLPSVCATVKQKFDPLENFLALRCKTKELAVLSDREDASAIPEGFEKKEELPSREVHDHQIKPCLMEQVIIKGKKTKHHLVKVQLSDAYRSLLSNLEKEASRYLNILKTNNEVPRSSSFQTLTPDVTRFLVKQREKYHVDGNIQASDDDTYRSIMCVHGLVSTAEILVICCLDSALGFLNAFQERYHSAIKNSLDTVHHSLLQSREKFIQQQIYHPKMTVMCKEIETWLRKKRAKSGDNEQKVLIIVKKDMPSLKNCLKKVLNLSKLLHPQVLETEDANSLIESLDDHNCLIVHTNQIAEAFPWAQFSLVVEYEYQENLEWKDHCERQNIRHMALVVMEQEQSVDCEDIVWKIDLDQCRELISLIASQHVTSNCALLQLLESRFNIQLYERDYSLLKFNKNLAFSDLDVDENTAIIIEDMGRLREDKTLHCVVTRMVSLSLKYTLCYCLFCKDKALSTGYPFPSHVIANLSKLQAAVVNFERRSKSNYNAKILLCQDVNDMAVTIRRICVERLISSDNTSMVENLERPWLATDITQEEKLLLENPCMSSFNAQVLLKAIGLEDIMTGSLDQLTKAAAGIARTTLLALCERIRKHKPAISNDKTKTMDSDIIVSDISKSTLKKQTADTGVSPIEEDKNPDYSHHSQLPDIETDKSEETLDSHRQKSFDMNNDVSLCTYLKSHTDTSSREVSSSASKYLINEDTPMSFKQRHHKQNSSNCLDIFEHTLTEKTNRQQGVISINQRPKISIPPKKARRQLEFEHIGLTEVERSFRQKYGSGRTPQKSDTVKNYGSGRTPQKSDTAKNYGSDRTPQKSDTGQKYGSGQTAHKFDIVQKYGSGRAPQKSDTRLHRHDNDIPNLNINQGLEAVGNFSLDLDENSSYSGGRHWEIQRQMEYTVDSDPHFSQAFHNTYDGENENIITIVNKLFNKPFVDKTLSLCENVVGQPVQTFDYNHGIPKQQEDNTLQRNVQHYLPVSDTSARRPLQGQALDTMVAFDKEYPPSVEIDRLVSHSNKCFNPESNKSQDGIQGFAACTGIENPTEYSDSLTFYNKVQQLANSGYDQYNDIYTYSNLINDGRLTYSNRHSSAMNVPNDQGFALSQYLQAPAKTCNLSRYHSKPESLSAICDAPLRRQEFFPQNPDNFLTELTASTMDRNKEIMGSPFSLQQNESNFQFLNQASKLSDVPTHANTERKNMSGKKTFFNPCMERLSLPPAYTAPVETETNTAGLYHTYSHEDKSQEAFWKLLQTKFGSSANRYPIQKRSIGLAQPLQRTKVVEDNKIEQNGNQSIGNGNQNRQNINLDINRIIPPAVLVKQDDAHTRMDVHQMNQTKRVDQTREYIHTPMGDTQTRRDVSKSAVPLWSSEEKRRMLQSPWATEDSPPMDLDYEDSQISMVLHPKLQEHTNRSVFTGATPDKKRRLSYERVPGKKGQTKLTFQ